MTSRRARVAVFISGRGSNLERLLHEQQHGILRESGEIVVVFADTPHAGGLAIARRYGVPVVTHSFRAADRTQDEQQVLADLAPFAVDFLVLAGYRRLLTSTLLNAFPGRVINIHPADSRQYQGLHGYRKAFEHGLPKTAVTVHYVDEGMDTGAIIAQAEVDLTGADTLEEVERRGLAVEHDLYPRVLAGIFSAYVKENRSCAE